MPENSLKLTADNSQLIQKLREVQKASQDVTDTVTESTKKQKDTVESLTAEWKKLYQEQKKGFSDVNAIKEYEKRLAEVKAKLKDLTDAEKESATAQATVTKKTDELGEAAAGLGKKLGPIAIAITAITAVSKAVVEAFKDTVVGMKLTTTAGELWKTMAYNIATANFNMAQSFVTAIAAAKVINEERVLERKDLVEVAKLRKEYNQLYFESNDRTQTDQERLAKINETMAKHNELINKETEDAKRQLVIVELQLNARPKSNKLLDEEAKLLARLQEIEGQRFSETKRLESQRTNLQKEIHDKQIKAWHDEIEEQNKAYDKELERQKQYNALAKKLMDDYDKSQIESLEGKAKLQAQRNFGIKQIKELRDQIAKLGPLTDEQLAMLQGMADNVWKAYYDALAKDAKETKATPEQQKAISGALLGNLPALPGLVKKDAEKVRQDIENQVKSNKEFSIWNLIGLDPNDDQDKEAIDGLKQAYGEITKVFEDTLQTQVDLAQRRRELLDTQVSELQQELNTEAELYKAGYASNVTEKRKELEDMKKQRDKALAEEQKAIKAQQAFETIQQTTALITAAAQTFKALPGPLLPIAIGLVAAMFAAFAAAKAKAAAATKLAEGGSGTDTGMITGKKHSQGGERFLDKVEVERGEAWGVLSARATQRYGKIFHEMVHSFNKGELPELIAPSVKVNPVVNVDMKGNNTRLDAIKGELHKANVKKEVIISGNTRIIKTGHHTRIIRK